MFAVLFLDCGVSMWLLLLRIPPFMLVGLLFCVQRGFVLRKENLLKWDLFLTVLYSRLYRTATHHYVWNEHVTARYTKTFKNYSLLRFLSACRWITGELRLQKADVGDVGWPKPPARTPTVSTFGQPGSENDKNGEDCSGVPHMLGGRNSARHGAILGSISKIDFVQNG